jgi:uncharacterized protein
LAVLLEGNVLVALAVADHLHHGAARRWFRGVEGAFATTPITQGTLLRLLVRNGMAASEALAVLRGFTRHARHDFWPADRPYDGQARIERGQPALLRPGQGREALRGVLGHRQVTDGYLAALARAKKGRLATFDSGLATLHADVAELVTT